MISVVLGILIFILSIALILVVVDSYFYPFMSAQMYEGSCTKTDDCRKGLECRPNPKDLTKKICLGAAAETCAKCEPGAVINETSCGDLIKAAKEDATSSCSKCEPGTAPVIDETSCKRFIDAKTCDANSCKTLIDEAILDTINDCPAAATQTTCQPFYNENNCQSFVDAKTCSSPANIPNCSQFCNCSPPPVNPLQYSSITLRTDVENCPAQTFYKMNNDKPGWVGDHILGDKVHNLLYMLDPVDNKLKLYCKPEYNMDFNPENSTQFIKFDPNDSRLSYLI